MSAQRRTATGSRRTRGGRGSTNRRSAPKTTPVNVNGAGTATTEVVAPPAAPAKATSAERAPASPKAPAPAKRTRQGQAQLTGWRLLVARLRRWYNDTRAELHRVTWPDRETVRNLTVIVIAVSAFLGLLLGGIDYILLQIFEALT